MLIRELRHDEVEEALKLVWRVFEEFEAPEYSEQGVSEFKKFISFLEVEKRCQNGELMLGAFEADKLVGVLSVNVNRSHISLMFVDKKYHRRGVARAMFNEAINQIKPEYLTVNSSPYAVEAYKKLGFMQTEEKKVSNGIIYVPMKFFMQGVEYL
jgi:GNAT superfamily N-acetyltransferase